MRQHRPPTQRRAPVDAPAPLPTGRSGTGTTRPDVGRGAQMVMVLLGAWVMVGLMVDGWAHANRPQLETFFTPWHAVFYSGLVATTGWLVWLTRWRRPPGHAGWAALPRGYELGAVGLLVFAAGGLADLGWHLAFGTEQDLEALLSPTHLLLFAGLLLLLTSPLRAAWSTPDTAAADDAVGSPRLTTLLPAVLSVALVTALCAFMLLYLSVFEGVEPLQERPPGVVRAPRLPTSAAHDLSIRVGIGSILVTTVVLVAPLLVLLRRWPLPFGSAALLFTLPSVLLTAIHEFWLWPLIPAALASGLLTDGVMRLVHAGPGRVGATRGVATAAALFFAGLYMLTVRLVWDTWWSLELGLGSVLLAGLIGLLLSCVALPPAVPAEPAPRH